MTEPLDSTLHETARGGAPDAPTEQRVEHADSVPAEAPGGIERWQLATAAVMIVILVIGVFGQTVRFDFLEWDDSMYVSRNEHIVRGLSLRSIRWALRDGPFHEWHPLAVWSHLLDCTLFGLWPGGHHLSNVLFHAAASVVLLIAFARLTNDFWPSVVVTTLFAIHPLHVESVAWVSERRDVLSALCFALTLWAYHAYATGPTWWRYLAVAVALWFGLMSKTILVTVPIVLLLLDYWPLRRFVGMTPGDTAGPPPGWRTRCIDALWLMLEKVPLMTLAVAASVIEMRTHNKGHDPLDLRAKIANALVATVVYLRQFAWPVDLAAYYQHPGAGIPRSWTIAAAVFLAAMSAVALLGRRRWPYLFVGWFWYLVMLGPVLGLVQVGRHAHADRYTYLSQIGIYIAIAWGVADLARSRAIMRTLVARRALVGIAAVWLGALTIAAWWQTTHWRNTETLWRHALAVAPASRTAECGLAKFLLEKGEVDEAAEHFQATLSIVPVEGTINDISFDWVNGMLGDCYSRLDRLDDAADAYQQSLAISPNTSQNHNSLATVFARQGKLERAIEEYRAAAKLDPARAAYAFNLGNALWQQGQMDEAIVWLKKAIGIDPNLAQPHYNLAEIYVSLGQTDEALLEYERVLEIMPSSREALLAASRLRAEKRKHP